MTDEEKMYATRLADKLGIKITFGSDNPGIILNGERVNAIDLVMRGLADSAIRVYGDELDEVIEKTKVRKQILKEKYYRNKEEPNENS